MKCFVRMMKEDDNDSSDDELLIRMTTPMTAFDISRGSIGSIGSRE